jgi:maltose O-acetyltransferase
MINTEMAKMLAGALYQPADAELTAARERAQSIIRQMQKAQAAEIRASLLRRLLGGIVEGTVVREGFRCDYGSNIHIGRNGFVNFDCVFLDCAAIDIGDDLQMGPLVQLYTPDHPVDADLRRSGVEYARPIRIGNNVWIGGGAIVRGGVIIGDNSIIGAGSVVTRDIPADSLAVGNPARVVRSLVSAA